MSFERRHTKEQKASTSKLPTFILHIMTEGVLGDCDAEVARLLQSTEIPQLGGVPQAAEKVATSGSEIAGTAHLFWVKSSRSG